jgi:Na+/proline symporter
MQDNPAHYDPAKVSLLRRFDFLAVLRPGVVTGLLVASLALGTYALIGLVSFASEGDWGIAAVSATTVCIAIVGGSIALRAKRRAPETKRWLEEYERLHR